MSGTGQAGHLPGNLEDLTQARSTHVIGGALPAATLGDPGLCPLPQTDPALPTSMEPPSGCPHASVLILPEQSELGSAPFQGCGPPRPPAPTPAHVCPELPVGALCSQTCAPAWHACPAPCQASTESGRASPPLAPGVDGWVCFSLHVLGSGERKKKSPNELSLGHFSLHFSAQVSLKGTSLSVSNSFALNSSRSFARAV